MPYVKEENREKFDVDIASLSEKVTCEGDLNYIISVLMHDRLSKIGLNYQNANNLVGMLECAKMELYRTIIAPYENIKMDENGRISELNESFFKTFVK